MATVMHAELGNVHVISSFLDDQQAAKYKNDTEISMLCYCFAGRACELGQVRQNE